MMHSWATGGTVWSAVAVVMHYATVLRTLQRQASLACQMLHSLMCQIITDHGLGYPTKRWLAQPTGCDIHQLIA